MKGDVWSRLGGRVDEEPVSQAWVPGTRTSGGGCHLGDLDLGFCHVGICFSWTLILGKGLWGQAGLAFHLCVCLTLDQPSFLSLIFSICIKRG